MSDEQGPSQVPSGPPVRKLGPFVKIAVIPVAAAAGILLGVGLFASDPANIATPTETEDIPAAQDENDQDSDGETSAPPAQTTANEDETPTTGVEVVILPSEMILVGASAEVTGFGTGAFFEYGLSPKDHVEGTAADLLAAPALKADAASCTLVRPFTLSGIPNPDKASSDIDPAGFDAALTSDANNYVSVGATSGVVTGGFSIGGEGRGNSQQWPLDGGSLHVELYFDATPAENWITVVATWSGISTENFSGEEASGGVSFACLFQIAE